MSIVKASGIRKTIINDDTRFSKIEAGRLELESIPYELVKTTTDIILSQQARAAAKGLTLDVHFQDRLPAVVLGDPVRLGQIITNLLGNAIKSTEAGRIAVNVRCVEELPSGDHRLEVSVSDTGIGIAQEKLDSIGFEAFVQSDSSVTRQFGGTGLGLATSHRSAGPHGRRAAGHQRPGPGKYLQFSILSPARHD